MSTTESITGENGEGRVLGTSCLQYSPGDRAPESMQGDTATKAPR